MEEPTCSRSDLQQSGSDDGQATLQANTWVEVIGNNRTKQSLIGMRGRVLNAGDLGGWHTLELETGETVRIQRNALIVLEQPGGIVVEQRLAEGSAGLPKLPFVQQQQHMQQHMQQQRLPPAGVMKRPAPVTPPRDAAAGQGIAARKPTRPTRYTRINFNKLDSGALRKYRRHYNLNEMGPNPTRDELVSSVSRHFSRQVVDEGQVINALINVGRRRSMGAGAS